MFSVLNGTLIFTELEIRENIKFVVTSFDGNNRGHENHLLSNKKHGTSRLKQLCPSVLGIRTNGFGNNWLINMLYNIIICDINTRNGGCSTGTLKKKYHNNTALHKMPTMLCSIHDVGILYTYNVFHDQLILQFQSYYLVLFLTLLLQ